MIQYRIYLDNCSAHIVFLALALTGLFVHAPCHAQSRQNLDYWENEYALRKLHFSQMRTDINFIFQSRVVCDSSFTSIQGCHIVNVTQNTGTVSDAYGDFKITANVGDSISFSALGYEKATIVLAESMYNYGYIVKLKPKAYELSEVTVTPFRIDLPKISKYEIYTPPLPNQGGVNLLPVEVNPITFFYNKYSREGKQKRYYKTVIDGTADYMRIGEKFNGVIVAQITGLKDDELVKFMSYCNFSNDFILNYSLETIKRAIKQKFQEWLR
jgi:hypothetical protein